MDIISKLNSFRIKGFTFFPVPVQDMFLHPYLSLYYSLVQCRVFSHTCIVLFLGIDPERDVK